MDNSSHQTTNLVRLCRAAEVEEGEGLRVDVEGYSPIAVFHFKGEFFATDDTCSHGDASLAEGSVEDGHVECPWHNGRFCLKTGAALTFPAVDPIRVYTTLVQEGDIFIQSEK